MSDHEAESTSAPDVRRMHRELRVRDAERFALRRGLGEVRADLQRIDASRAWRWGHGVASLLARLLRRSVRTRGAVEQALDRIDRLDRMLAPSEIQRRPSEGRASFCVKLAAASRDTAHLGGDFHFAMALVRELEQRGHHARVEVLPEEELAEEAEEVVIVLWGRARHAPQAAQLNVLWVISHPAELEGAECDGYDLVCVASDRFAQGLRTQTRTPVVVLAQATDPEAFYPEPVSGTEHELVFVGNSRGVRRAVLDDLLPTSRDLAVYGSGWDGVIDPRYVVSPHVPNDELRRLYSSSAIVLNDHWPDMRAHGFISNRVYDAVACGALVLSDHVDGIEERFGGAVVTYESREHLSRLVERFLANPAERQARGAAGRDLVLAAHTFAHRVDVLLDALAQQAAAAGFPSAIPWFERGRS